MSYLTIAQGTARVKTANRATPIPEIGILRTRSIVFTASNGIGGAATLYLKFASDPGTAGAATRETTLIPMAKGQSVTFTGVPIGMAGYHDMSFGTGFSYIYGSATSLRMVYTYVL